VSAEDYIADFDPFGEPDYLTGDDDDGYPRGTKCNRCGATGLNWFNTGVRWVLIGDKGPHQCQKTATANDFKD